MGGGPLVGAVGLLLFQRVGLQVDYVSEVLPALLVFAVGLSMTVAPLTAAVLAGAGAEQAGIASGVNNAIARVAGLLGTAALGAIVAASFASSLESRLAGTPLGASARAAVREAKRLPLGRPDVHGLPPAQGRALASAAEQRLAAQLPPGHDDRRGAAWRSGAWWAWWGFATPASACAPRTVPGGQLVGASTELAHPARSGALEAQPTGSRA